MSAICSTYDVPRKGNVDRNKVGHAPRQAEWQTFPARGTWIEMRGVGELSGSPLDVPRKGNVDRNDKLVGMGALEGSTFPARGTWIEITGRARRQVRLIPDVPRKGNVDRNAATKSVNLTSGGRSPQGERG